MPLTLFLDSHLHDAMRARTLLTYYSRSRDFHRNHSPQSIRTSIEPTVEHTLLFAFIISVNDLPEDASRPLFEKKNTCDTFGRENLSRKNVTCIDCPATNKYVYKK